VVRPLRALVIAALLAGCSDKVVSVQTSLVTTACEGAQPLDGVTHLEFLVSGDGIGSPIEQVFPVNARAGSVPDIPPGANRVLEVRGFAGDPAQGGRVVSRGRSMPFDVPSAVPAQGVSLPGVQIVMRRVNTFVAPSAPGQPGICASMTTPRAGHSATLLADGRVFIAGGFTINGVQFTTLQSAEIFDPLAGTFAPAPDLGITDAQQLFTPTPRAFQTATRLPQGQVLLAGGEVEDGGTPVPLDSALVFDPGTNVYGAVTLSHPRSHAAAAEDSAGRVLLVGGVDGAGAIVDAVEWFDSSNARTFVSPETFHRRDVAAAAIGDGSQIAVAGGTDGSALQPDVRLFTFAGGSFVSSAGPTLHEPRRNAALAPFQSSANLLVVGGFGDATEPPFTPLASTEVLTSGTTVGVLDGPTIAPRGDACAAILADGQVLTAGGTTIDTTGVLASSDAVELITTSPNGSPTALGMPPLPAPRAQHTCTTLADGSVLVLGGVLLSGGAQTVLSDAAIFMPAPKD
jgi:hypothetical protein